MYRSKPSDVTMNQKSFGTSLPSSASPLNNVWDSKIESYAPALSASLMCADLGHIYDEVARLECLVDMLHFDIMDGHFVANMALSPQLLSYVASTSTMPLDVHLMVDDCDWILHRISHCPTVRRVAVHQEAFGPSRLKASLATIRLWMHWLALPYDLALQ